MKAERLLVSAAAILVVAASVAVSDSAGTREAGAPTGRPGATPCVSTGSEELTVICVPPGPVARPADADDASASVRSDDRRNDRELAPEDPACVYGLAGRWLNEPRLSPC